MARIFTLAVAFALFAPSPSWAAHAYGQFGDVKYPPSFAHFDWVNPDAPKGGELLLVPPLRITQFDKYNPFTLKGTAPPGLGALMFESLLTGTMDEPTTAYGLLAEDIEVAPDKLAVVFRLRPEARFHDGEPVRARDVVHSFKTLVGEHSHPAYRAMFADVKDAVALGDRVVRFDFAEPSAELPLLVGSMPVWSRAWGAGKPFDRVVTDTPIASGPYRIGRVNFGRDITYERDRDYWAKDLNVRRGMYNFDRVTYKIYKDQTAQTEAFKAGEFDYIQVFSARDWARTYTGRKFDEGELIRRNVQSGNAGDFQGFLINSRKEHLRDPRVRKALELALDFEWMNRRFFYDSYERVRGFFVASDFEATGLPGEDELAVFASLFAEVAPEILSTPVPLPPSTAAPGSLRKNLRAARRLLAEAGWVYRDGALRDARGEPFTIEFLDSEGSMGRIITPYMQALEKLGMRCQYKMLDFALLQKRYDVFDFDLTTLRIPGSEAPGSELKDRFTSAAADTEGSGNFAGIKDPVVDELVALAGAARTRPELIARLCALDRTLRFGHYTVAQWYTNAFRIAYRAGKFAEPEVKPRYFQPESWIVATWWSK